jgi:muramoyltetrapeptide carboxypeptidase
MSAKKSHAGMRKPKALRTGDTVAIVAPASPIEKELLDAGCKRLQRMGYRPLYLPTILNRDLYFAGSVERRARELEEMSARDDVRAILCARGGYGSNYLLEKLDWKKIKGHPKILVGYSDATALLTTLVDSGMVVFHGPMLTKDFAETDGLDEFSWQAAVSGERKYQIQNHGALPIIIGKAKGKLYGGCLSILVASLGTPWEIRTQGTILFIEDVNTKPFQIDRMLRQLLLAGKLRGVRGVIFGEMKDCAQAGQGYSLPEVISRVLGDLDIPVAFGFRSGHVSRGNITLPLGVQAKLEVGKQVTLEILEAATV